MLTTPNDAAHVSAMEGPVTPASALPGSYAGWPGTAQARVSRQECPWRNAAAGIVASFLTPPSGRPRRAPSNSTATSRARRSSSRRDCGAPACVDFEPDSPPIRHTHPGEEIIYVRAGSLEYRIDGQPTKVYNAGQARTVPAGITHAVRNAGTSTGTGTALATDVVEKGEALLTVAQ